MERRLGQLGRPMSAVGANDANGKWLSPLLTLSPLTLYTGWQIQAISEGDNNRCHLDCRCSTCSNACPTVTAVARVWPSNRNNWTSPGHFTVQTESHTVTKTFQLNIYCWTVLIIFAFGMAHTCQGSNFSISFFCQLDSTRRFGGLVFEAPTIPIVFRRLLSIANDLTCRRWWPEIDIAWASTRQALWLAKTLSLSLFSLLMHFFHQEIFLSQFNRRQFFANNRAWFPLL